MSDCGIVETDVFDNKDASASVGDFTDCPILDHYSICFWRETA